MKGCWRGGRYIDKLLAVDKLQEALNSNSPDFVLRLNYLPEEYVVVRKDTGHRIARKRGIQYELIRDANPTVAWNCAGCRRQHSDSVARCHDPGRPSAAQTHCG